MLTTKALEVLVAKNLQQVRSPIRDLAAVADELRRQGKTVVMLNIGDPLDADFSTPPELVDAVVEALRNGKNGYAPALGVPEALHAIRGDAERKGIRNIQDVFITDGVSEAVDICLTALLNPGDDLLVPRPGYPLYTAVLAKIGAGRNPYDLAEELDWEPDVEGLAARVTPSTRGIVLINPNNPTGAVHSRRTLEAIAELARRHNLVIFADEIYDRVTFDGADHVPLATLAPDIPVVTFGGLSKGFLATGWRVGWCVVSGPAAALRSYMEGMHKLLRHALVRQPSGAVRGATGARRHAATPAGNDRQTPGEARPHRPVVQLDARASAAWRRKAASTPFRASIFRKTTSSS